MSLSRNLSFLGEKLSSSGIVSPAGGGTGATIIPPNGALPIGNGTLYSVGTLTAGAGISITNGVGSITISTSASGGTVTSLAVSGGSTGLTTSGGPITTSGTITIAGTLSSANGGTGTTATPTNGQLHIGNGSGFSLAALTAGTNIVITNSTGGISISAPNVSIVGPVMQAYPSAASTGISQGAYVLVPFNTASFDTASGLNTSNYRYTPGVAGYYSVQATVALRDTSGILQAAIELRLNGTTINQQDFTGNAPSSVVNVNPSLNTYVKLTASDYLEVLVYGLSGGSLAISGGTSPGYPSIFGVAFLRGL